MKTWALGVKAFEFLVEDRWRILLVVSCVLGNTAVQAYSYLTSHTGCRGCSIDFCATLLIGTSCLFSFDAPRLAMLLVKNERDAICASRSGKALRYRKTVERFHFCLDKVLEPTVLRTGECHVDLPDAGGKI